jgi:AmpD protein
MGRAVAPSLTSPNDLQPRSIDPAGWLSPVVRCPSPNFNARPTLDDISLLVIHNISLPPGQFGNHYVERFFCNQLPRNDHPYFATICHLEVSAHCLIDRDGRVTQFVSFADRAWHAGASSFSGRDNCNDFSIGIELEGTDDQPYADAQYTSLVAITRLLLVRYPALNAQRIVGHSAIAPGRKTDPGPAFDWQQYFGLLGQQHF